MSNNYQNFEVVIDFYAVLDTPQEMVIIDTSYIDRYTNFEIKTMQLTLTNSIMPDYIHTADLIPYIYSKKRDKQLYTITSDMLGLSEGQVLPDGSYTVTIDVNNAFSTENTFIVFQDVEEKTLTILRDSGFSIDTDQTNLLYQDSNKYDFELMTILASLLETIKQNALDKNIEAAMEALDKLQRTLQTITDSDYNII